MIPKSNSLERIVHNLGSNDFNLTDEELKEIGSLNLNVRVSTSETLDSSLLAARNIDDSLYS